jgi:hypothetical protein
MLQIVACYGLNMRTYLLVVQNHVTPSIPVPDAAGFDALESSPRLASSVEGAPTA